MGSSNLSLVTATLSFFCLLTSSSAAESLYHIVGVNTASDDVTGSTGYWVKEGSTGALVRATTDSSADDDIQWAIDQGANVVLSEGNFSFSNALVFRSGMQMRGQGKSGTTLSLSTDITPLHIANRNDVEIFDLLIIASTSQTQPLIKLTATNTTMARNNIRGVQLAGVSANTFTAIQLHASVSGGIWNCLFDDISVSNVGTIVELNCQPDSAWINSNRFNNFYANDFLIGMDIVYSGGVGSNGNWFSNWAIQCSERTIFGLRIPNSTEGVNADNVLYACDFIDLLANGKYFSLGSGVKGTIIVNTGNTAECLPSKYVDHGIDTLLVTNDDYFAKLLRRGNLLFVPTQAGWTQGATGSGSTSQQISYNLVRTGTTTNSSSRLYSTAPMFGFQNSYFPGIDYNKQLIWIFNYARSVSATSAIARVQLKNATTEGVLSGKGLGIKIVNSALFGESFGASQQEVNLSTTLAMDQSVQVMIIFYPGSRIEWWIDGVLKGTQSTATFLPSGGVVSSLVHSISTTGQTSDAQSYLMHPKLWQSR